MSAHSFAIVCGAEIAKLMPSMRGEIITTVRDCYLQHDAGLTNNPDSYFLRFENSPRNRIIALPASISDDQPVSGIKWIASYPENIEKNLQRASAVLLLNDYHTGYPFACLEASQISAARTAASAVIAARALTSIGTRNLKITFVGAGVIARTILDFFSADAWHFSTITVTDPSEESSSEFARYANKMDDATIHILDDVKLATSNADIVVFATNTSAPFVSGDDFFRSGQIVLNVSLRDIDPDIIWDACNIFDDVDHCMKANTSAHLALQKYGNLDFVNGTIAQVLNDPNRLDRTRPLIFSPFGLGVLDLAVGRLFYERTKQSNSLVSVPGFFPDVFRWPTSA